MAKPSPVNPEMSEFSRRWLGTSPELISKTRENLKGLDLAKISSRDVEKAVARAWGDMGLTGKVEDWIMKGVEESILKGGTLGIADPIGFRRWWLNKLWPGDTLTLAQQISKAEYRTKIIATIQEQLKASKSWQTVAQSLTDAQLVKGELAGYMQDVVNSGRRVLKSDPGALASFQKSAKKARRNIERLAASGAPTTRLKKAYANLVNVVESKNEAAFAGAIDRAVKAKARANAERIARTEMVRAYAEGVKAEGWEDEDVIGYRSVLSTRHPEPDICDVHANADMWGAGKGVFPKAQGPSLPYHPHCGCSWEEIFIDEVEFGAFDPKGGEKYLSKQSKDRRKKMMGTQGAEDFKKFPGRWQGNLKNWKGHESLAPRVPRDMLVTSEGHKLNGKEWAGSLSSDERRVVTYWQGSGFEKIRDIQVTGKGPANLKKAIGDFEGALDRAEPYSGKVWRGLHDLGPKDFARMESATELNWNALSSSAKTQNAALRFARPQSGGQSVMFEIRNKTGVDLTAVVGGEEAEVVLRRDAKYRILDRNLESHTVGKQSFDILKIIMEEI